MPCKSISVKLVEHAVAFCINRFELNELADIDMVAIIRATATSSGWHYQILNKSHKDFDTNPKSLL